MENFPGYKRLFRFDADCKLKTLEFMRSSPSLDPNAINIFTHMLLGEKMWLSRLELGLKAPPLKLSNLWQGQTLDRCGDELQSVIDHWTRYITGLSEEDYSKQVSFINLKGTKVDRPVLRSFDASSEPLGLSSRPDRYSDRQKERQRRLPQTIFFSRPINEVTLN